MLEFVADEQQPITLTYKKGIVKCNQLLNFLRKQQVHKGDSVFIICGLHPDLWTSYLTAIKGGFILIPAASILNAEDIVYRFQKASPKVVITDKENLVKIEQALCNSIKP